MEGAAHVGRRGYVPGGWMLLVAVLWTAVEAVGALVPRGYAPLQVVTVRYVTHLVCLVCLVRPRGWLTMVQTRRPVMQSTRGLMMLCMPLLFLASVQRLHVSEVWGVFWATSPVFAAVLAAVWLRERVKLAIWAALVVGCCGAFALFTGGLPDALRRAYVLPLAMGASYAVYQVMTRRMQAEDSPATDLFYTAVMVLVGLLPFVRSFWRPLTFEALAPMVGIGVLGLLFLFALENALRDAPVALAAPLGLAQALVALATPLGRGGLDNAAAWAGLGCVAVAIGYVWRQLPREAGRAI